MKEKLGPHDQSLCCRQQCPNTLVLHLSGGKHRPNILGLTAFALFILAGPTF